MRDLNHDFKNLCQRNRDGSLATQHDRESILSLIAKQLDEDGFRHLRASGVRAKHVEHLVERWHTEEIAPETFKNRMSALRWLAEKIDKQNIVARENASYGIAERRYVSNVSKAHELDAELTGWKAPAAGGPTSKQLSPEQKRIDREARLTISRELGHEREQITAVYLGR